MLLSNLNQLATAPGGVARLRELILTLAVQGKLVPQDPNDEPASELLKKIRVEKDRLIAAGKIKRDKPLAEITEEEKPFGLPKGWEWIRLGTLLPFRIGKTPPSKDPQYWGNQGYAWVSISDMTHFGEVLETSRKITAKGAGVFGYEPLPPGTLIMSFKLTIGKIAVLRVPAYHNEAIVSLMPLAGLQTDFLKYMLPTVSKTGASKDALMGATLNTESLSNLIVALPPEVEQSRIVTRVEELLRLCDALEAKGQLEAAQHAQLVATLLGALTDSDTPAQLAENWQRVASHFDLLLDRPQAVDALEQTILQLAVRGLLVPQDPQDEPASALLKKIRAEKDKLIAQGKIKRDKPLSPIAEDEQPCVLPPGWEWVRMGDVIDGGSGTTPLRARADYFANGTEMWVKTTDLTNGIVTTCEELITKAAVVENRLKYFPPGTVCVAMYGGAGTIGKSGVLGISSTINQSVFALPPTEGIDVGFLHTYVITVRSLWMSFAAGLRKDPNINGQIIKKMVMPLPPLAEQSRIVTRVTQLRHLCAELRARLSTSQSTQAQLAEALVQEVA